MYYIQNVSYKACSQKVMLILKSVSQYCVDEKKGDCNRTFFGIDTYILKV